MPLYRSARLFTLGLALAGTCSAQNTLENEPTRQSVTAPKSGKAQIKASQAERKAIYARQQRRSETASIKTKA